MSFMLRYPRVNRTLSGSYVHLIATAGDSVYAARCCQVPFVLCRIQMFVNFSSRFIYGSDTFMLILFNETEVLSTTNYYTVRL